jgi:uncharacterized caspase-like protein
MRKPFAVIAAALVLCVMAAQDATAERRVALVIGNSAYKHVGRLPNPVNDAAAIATLLRVSGFDVIETKRDLGINEMRRTIRDFSDHTRNADIAVVFFAGHGIEVDGTNYLLPTDAALERDIDVEDEGIALDRILRLLDPVKRLRLVILDACRDNPFTKKMTRTVASRSIGRGLAKVEPASSDTLIAFAAKAGSIAADGEGLHSPFTTALLNNLAKPGVDLRIAFGRIRDDVLKATASKQEPFVYGSLGGTTVSLVPAPSKPAAVAAPAPAADPVAAVRRDYELAAQVGTKEAWDYFLAIHSSGYYANLAKAQRAKIVALETKAAEEKKRAEAKPMVVASAPAAAPVETQRSPTPGVPNETDIARSLQAELRRVGCYPGALNGNWDAGSRRALELFNKHAGMQLDVKLASLDSVDVLKGKTTRICPLQCDRGYRADKEVCVKIACPRGQVVDDDGACVKKEQPRSATRPQPAPQAQQAPQAPAAGTGRVLCTEFSGCQQVKPGCREVKPAGHFAHARIVCD